MVDVVTGSAGNLIAKIGEKLIVGTGRHLGYMLYYNNYVESLKQLVDKLMVKSQGIMLEVEDARRNGDTVALEVEQWLTNVDVIIEESRRFLEDEVEENKVILNGWFQNIKKRYILSKKAKRKIDPELCEIAAELAKRCGGLPIALVRLGGILKDKRKEVWRDTLVKLETSRLLSELEGNEESSQFVQGRYDNWKNEEAKKLFLLTYRVYIQNMQMAGLKR